MKGSNRGRAAATVDGYRGLWFTLGQHSKYGDKYSGGLGTYTANHSPLAIYAEAVDKTFFVYAGTPSAERRHLLNMISYYDHAAHRLPKPRVVHDKQGVDDPHDNASLGIDEDGHLWVFVSGRARVRPGFLYRSRTPYSIDGFDLVEEREMTYCQPHPHGDGWLHLFTKYSAGRELYWERIGPNGYRQAAQRLAGMGGHYQVSASAHGVIGSAFMYHPGGDVDRRTNLYYVQTRDGGLKWTTAAGRELSPPLIDTRNEALVIDYEAEGLNVYIHDLNFDDRGWPAILYLTSRGGLPGPEQGPHRWRVTYWTGSRWQTETIADSDHNYDTGALLVTEREWRVIGPTEPGWRRWATGGEVAAWSRRHSEGTWRKISDVTRGSRTNHCYVRRVISGQDPFSVFWADGDPAEPGRSCLYFAQADGGACWQLPYVMNHEYGEPAQL